MKCRRFLFSDRKKRWILSFRFMLILLFTGLIHVSADHTYSQSRVTGLPAGNFNLSFRNAPLAEVLKAIQDQGDYTFVYSNDDIDTRQLVSVRVTDAGIEQVMAVTLRDTGIEYEMHDRQILLKKQAATLSDNQVQEQRVITGRVTDQEDGSPLPGANITLKGSTTGTITDMDGNYQITIPETATSRILVFSFVGYGQKEVEIGDQSVINVSLSMDVKRLDEIVVIGYGTSSRKLLTSSIADVRSDELQGAISTGIEGAIQGKTAGVMVNQNSGTPGAAPTIRVRGISSVFAGTRPLYVVDGIPINTGDYSQIGFEGQGIDASANIDPNNIESISILKDAAASAIYGARAANGVVLITTKTGNADRSKISFNSYYGFQKEWRRLDMLNAEEWKEYVSEFDPGFVAGLDPNIDTDWQDEVFRVAPISNYELSLSGGDRNTRMYISGSYFNQEGVVLGSDYEKYNGRVNIDHNVSDRLRVAVKVGMNYSINNRIVGDQTINGVLPNAISKPPVYAVRDELGNYLEEGFWDNPVAIGNDVLNEARALRNLSSIEAEYKLTDHLSVKNQWGVDLYHLHEVRYEPTTVDRGAESNGIGIDARSELSKVTQQTTLKYMNTFNDRHNLDLLLGYSFEIFRDRFNRMRGNNFPNDNLRYLVSAGVIESASSDGNDGATNSWFGRALYNLDNKYIASATLRMDGSSRFGPNNRYGLFPSLSLAWRISEESFLSDIGWLSELKLKFSYGLTGNDQIPDFRYLNLYSSGYNYDNTPGIVPSQIPNPDLKWETTRNMNAGFDLSVFRERINLGVELYRNLTVDLLLPRPIPGSSGFSSVYSNVGSLENKGLEILLNTVNTTGSLRWTTDVNFSLNRNKVLELYNDQPFTDYGRGSNAVLVNEPVGVFFMYKSLGVDPSTGDLVFEDVFPDGEVTDADRTVVGDPNPDFTGGFTNTLSYKGFDLKIFFQFSYGNDIFNGTRQYAEAMKFGTSDNQLATIKDRWRQPGDITYVPRHNGTYNLFPISSHYLEDGSYLRLKELTIGYNFPGRLLNRSGFISYARVYVRGQNLWTLTPYSGMDPEVNYSGAGNIQQGTDFFTFPQVRTLVFGFNLTF